MLRSPFSMDEAALRERIRQALVAGTLPRQGPSRTWVGPGVDRDRRSYRLHRDCHAIWELERRADEGMMQRFEIGDRVQDGRQRAGTRYGRVIEILERGDVRLLTVEWDDGGIVSGPAERFERVP
jgi:hypothetical protein